LTVTAGLRDRWQVPQDLVEKANTVVDATGVHKKPSGK